MHDTTIAEAGVLGVLLTHPDQGARIFAEISPEDFTGPHALIAEAIHGLRVRRDAVDPNTVMQEMTRRGTLGRIGGGHLIARIATGLTTLASLDTYLAEIKRRVRLHRLTQLGLATQQAVEHPEADPATLAARVLASAQGVLDSVESDGDITTPTLREFLDTPDPDHDWVIPGLLERGDRLILTGSEGLGKSVLFRQLAVAAASGVHPFRAQAMPAVRVLYVDAENSVTQMRREMRKLAVTGRVRGGGADDNLYLECRPEGLDLTKAYDEAWLVRRVAALQPAILLTGPLYRLHADDPNKEQPAREVARVLDRCRSAAHCAVVVEAHAGHSSLPNGVRHVRPTGSSLWLRWPEYGYGLRAVKNYDPEHRLVDFASWRGDRAIRRWPRRLQAGGTWPWSEATYSEHDDAAVA